MKTILYTVSSVIFGAAISAAIILFTDIDKFDLFSTTAEKESTEITTQKELNDTRSVLIEESKSDLENRSDLAVENHDEAEAATNDQKCEFLGKFAEIFMTSRQIGMPLSTALESIPDSPLSEVMRTMILEAWGHPVYSTESISQSTISEFRDKWHLSCLKSVE